MKKPEMIESLKSQGEKIRNELLEMQQVFSTKKDTLSRIEGALEALSALESDVENPPPEVVDHTAAAAALGILK